MYACVCTHVYVHVCASVRVCVAVPDSNKLLLGDFSARVGCLNCVDGVWNSK